MAKVVLENVHKNYGAQEDAVKGASFTCNDGEFLVLLGPSGCGKTTTLRMITGLETITSGKIYIGDRVVNELSPQERNVAMAFETYALYPPLTVYENIAFPLQVMKLSRAEVDKRVKEVAESLSITDILNALPDSLAGGQMQRVSLARALVRDPTVFLMDEPLSHVDADVRHRARAEIKHIQKVSGKTVIYVTHDQIEAVALADRIIVMDLGVIQQIGTSLELYYKPVNLFVAGFIGEPPINIVDCKTFISDGTLTFAWKSDDDIALQFNVSEVPSGAMEALKGYDGREIVIGVRPQRLELGAPVQGDSYGFVHGNLLVHEFLGKVGIAQVAVDNKTMECITFPEISFQASDRVSLRFSFEDLHFFDPETTLRIDY
ncbi:MAG: ABC transporter ATP-binding protein [Anaerolineales bacterium]|jgi:multiple sugar transport system ATP-binding protein